MKSKRFGLTAHSVSFAGVAGQIAFDDITLGVPGPIAGAGLPGLIWRAVAFSHGGDGGRRSPEQPFGLPTNQNPA
jgi:hypothetical protein